MDEIPLSAQVEVYAKCITEALFADSAKMDWATIVDAIGAPPRLPLPAGVGSLQLPQVL